MNIRKIIINNYRSIKAIKIESLNDFNVFVGQNNHGKTNIFEAIEWFFNGPRKGESLNTLRHCFDKSCLIEVQIEFDGLQDAVQKMKNTTNAAKFKAYQDNETILIRRTSETEGKKREIFDTVNNDWKDPGTGFDRALDDLLPRFEYIDTKKTFEDVSSYKKTSPMGIVLSSLLTDIMETDQKYIEFKEAFVKAFNDDSENSGVRQKMIEIGNQLKEHLEKQFPDTEQVNTSLGIPLIDDLFKSLNIEINDGVNTRVCDKGDGMQRAVMLAIMELYADYRKGISNGKNNLFFIDEAEIHLHPSAQRRLKNVLLDLSGAGDQVFINTHSSVFIADENERQNIYQVFKENKQTKSVMVKEQDKPNVVFELLGGNPADLLLPYNFLIVEGRTEMTFLSKIIQRFYSDKPKIQIIEAQGDINKARRSFSAVAELFKPLYQSMYGNRAILICDYCEDTQIHSFVTTYGARENEQICRLPKRSIEEYYPQPWTRNPQQMSGKDKVSLADTVATNITKKQFETEMSCFFQALTNCWNKAFKKELN